MSKWQETIMSGDIRWDGYLNGKPIIGFTDALMRRDHLVGIL